MKQLITAFLILFQCCLYAQDTKPVLYDSLMYKGLLLDKGWKFSTGDNPDWARPGFNDQSWQSINPTLDIYDALPQLPKSGICWFRIQIALGNAAQKKQLALIIQQSGASQIYLNGLLVQQFGIVDADEKKIKVYDPVFKPLLLPVNNDTLKVLAVRFALQPGVRYSKLFGATNPALWVTLKSAEKAIDDYTENAFVYDTYNGFVLGLYLLFLLIHLAYYFFHPTHNANLYFGLYALFYLAFVFTPVQYAHMPNSKFYTLNLKLIFELMTHVLLLTAIYPLLNQKKDWAYWSLLLLIVPAFIINIWQYNWGWHAAADTITILFQLNIARVTLKAVQKKKKGAWLIAGGAICCLVLFVLFVSTLFIRPDLTTLINLFFVFSGLSIPITTSLYLGLNFGFISNTLKQKLNEVNQLSLKNLEQEKEKQQILSAQNETLEKQVDERTIELSKSLKELKETQSQLIQKEKMASLGELTAGIAHEIQNPLNFVNNFSEVNTELIDELQGERLKAQGERNEKLENEILNDIKENSQKINHHGKRAGEIVKGMLQHSRSSNGIKEATDINALCDEYLSLSYHGLRAKDNSFNATMKTGFDESIGNINIIPQDIGRVLLNLYNNGFYAASLSSKGGFLDPIYKHDPTVWVSTKKIGDKVLVSVRDNGPGIPPNIVDKIFQPFFTTKPTGQGTGLGLSLSYDIIKAHGGEIKVNTAKSSGTEFIITLPV
jgi:two-component system NtrC family sensor kinase